ncbi:cell division protein FtsZ [Tangfeifania diversioriginum]|uniref:Cell division protein FtsZ n=1 Tax=Tangfeifania diversioriginum TaxID=1168035 RepID=A0A1M6A1K5_9BACT|nr:cell division protein FtsZ [Tangfeifania diversioriginum]SHI30308.1 cell division protein FtsZ [Tangfeifania diversioriginum]
MTELVNFQFPRTSSTSIIKVIGVGGGGCNAVSHMFQEGIAGVDFIICNTDGQAMENSPVPVKIQLGVTLTEGRGAGNQPQMGEEAARENYEDLKNVLKENTKMLFITAGMGGGTGTGAAPVIAQLASELDILTIAVVTVPSPAEGKKRFGQAMEGIEKLGEYVDSMLVVSNQRLHNIFGDLPARQAFKMADNIVATAVKGVAEIITLHGNVNIDYTDVYTVMHNSNVFIMGTGVSSGEGRAMKAVNEALESPLLDSNDIYGTQNILLNIISGKDEITIGEIGEIIEVLQEKAGQDADIIWGNGYDESLEEEISVTILATGFVTNPNQLLQPKKEPEKYNLEEENNESLEREEEPVEVEAGADFRETLSEAGTKENEGKMGVREEKKKTPKTLTDRSIFSTKRNKRKKKKQKANEPVAQSNIDNWFYKNFGLGKLFEDDDQSMDE